MNNCIKIKDDEIYEFSDNSFTINSFTWWDDLNFKVEFWDTIPEYNNDNNWKHYKLIRYRFQSSSLIRKKYLYKKSILPWMKLKQMRLNKK